MTHDQADHGSRLPIPQRRMFDTPGFAVRELSAGQLPLLQALFDANPGYFLSVHGRPPRPDEAQVEFDEMPPSHLGFGKRWFSGVFGPGGTLEGVVDVVSDLAAPGVWHIALFLLATHLHGKGAASEILGALEAWAAAQGARWLRLGVAAGNERAERFWQRQGFAEVRQRVDPASGGRNQVIRVLVKPLARDGLAEYLSRVPRDRPDSPLP